MNFIVRFYELADDFSDTAKDAVSDEMFLPDSRVILGDKTFTGLEGTLLHVYRATLIMCRARAGQKWPIFDAEECVSSDQAGLHTR
jgi:hypothetical protein